MNEGNLKVWVCMSCRSVHFDPNRDYAGCINDGHAMYVGFVWPVADSDECEVCSYNRPAPGSKRCLECDV